MVGMVALLAPTLLGCQPGPPPAGFQVSSSAVPMVAPDAHVSVRASDGAIWSAGMSDGGIDRYDPASGDHASAVAPDGAVVNDLLPGPNGAVMAAVWTPDPAGGVVDGKVLRVGADLSVAVVLDLGPGSLPVGLAHDGLAGFWVSDGTGDRLHRVPFSGGSGQAFALPDGVGPSAVLATGPDAVWFVPAHRPGLGRLDPATGHVQVQPADTGPGSSTSMSFSLLVGPGGDLWYTRILGSHGLYRFDPETGSTVEVPVAELWPSDLAVGADGGLYATLACGIDAGLLRVDPVTLETTTYDVGLSSSRGTALGSLLRDGDGFWATTVPGPGLTHLDPVPADPA